MIKSEIKRAFQNPYFYIAIVVGIVISSIHFIESGIPMYEVWSKVVSNTGDAVSDKLNYIDPPLEIWIMVRTNKYQYLYFYMLPLLTVIPYGASYCADRKNGYRNQLLVRTSRKKYRMSKMIATFISGGCIAVIPLLLNLLMCMCVLPWAVPLSSTKLFSVMPMSVFSNIFYSKPVEYVILVILMEFFFWGMFACSALTISLVEEHVVVVMLSPFIIHFAIMTILSKLLSMGEYAATQFMFFPSFYKSNVSGVCIFILILFAIDTVFIWGNSRDAV